MSGPAVTIFARIRIALLDLDARLVSDIVVLSAVNPKNHATEPAVATNGTEFLVVWNERDDLMYRTIRVAGVRVDSRGKPIGSPVALANSTNNLAPRVFWNGSDFQVWADISPSPALVAGDATVFANAGNGPSTTRCAGGLSFCFTIPGQFEVNWSVTKGKQSSTGMLRETRHDGHLVAVAGDETQFIVAWNSINGIGAMRIRDGVASLPFYLPATLSPDASLAIAFDGVEYVLVYESRGDVHGALINATDDVIGTPFPLSMTSHIEAEAQVQAIHRGRFLVSYSSDDNRIASRIVVTALSRRRALR